MANHSPRSHFRSEILQCPFNLLSHLHWTKIIQELRRENFTIKYSSTRREWNSTNVLVILKSCFKRKARKAALLFCSVLDHFTLYVSQLQPQHVSFKCANDVNMGSLWDVFLCLWCSSHSRGRTSDACNTHYRLCFEEHQHWSKSMRLQNIKT